MISPKTNNNFIVDQVAWLSSIKLQKHFKKINQYQTKNNSHHLDHGKKNLMRVTCFIKNLIISKEIIGKWP